MGPKLGNELNEKSLKFFLKSENFLVSHEFSWDNIKKLQKKITESNEKIKNI
jgi:hypothetical protein